MGASSPETQTCNTFSVRTRTRSSVSSGTPSKRKLWHSLRSNADGEHEILLPEWPTRPTMPWKSWGIKMVTNANESYILTRKTSLFTSVRRCDVGKREKKKGKRKGSKSATKAEPMDGGTVYTQSRHICRSHGSKPSTGRHPRVLEGPPSGPGKQSGGLRRSAMPSSFEHGLGEALINDWAC